MADYRLSYWKTTVATAVAALTAMIVVLVLGLAWTRQGVGSWVAHVWFGAVMLLTGLAMAWLALVATGGLIALRRDALEAKGQPYAQGGRREWLPGRRTAKWRSVLRRLLTFKHSRTRLGLRP